MDLLVVGDTGSTQLPDAPDTARGSFKFRIFGARSKRPLKHSAGTKRLARALGKAATPAEFVRLQAQAVGILLEALPEPRVTKLINGFPSYVRGNQTPYVANLYCDGPEGARARWRDVDLGALWREAVADDPRWELGDDAVLVVNDMLPGIAGFLQRHEDKLDIGDQVLYVMPGGGCGVIQATLLPGGALITGTEQGHNQYVDAGTGESYELEQRWASAPALADTAQRLAAAAGDASAEWGALDARGVTELGRVGNEIALRACEEFVRALCRLAAHHVQCGVNVIGLCGKVVGGVDRALRQGRGQGLRPTARGYLNELAQAFLIQQHGLRIIVDSREPDNTQGGIALVNAQQIAPGKGNLWTIPWPIR